MNEKLFNPDYLQNLCHKYGLRPSKKYGQNYLIDPAPIEAMIAAGEVSSNDTVVEVGPGFGVLTYALLEKAGSVVAFEIEKKIEAYWEVIKKSIKQENKKTSDLVIVWGNVLVSLREPTKEGRSNPPNKVPGMIGDRHVASLLAMTPYKLISNLPYQITSQVIRTFLEAENPPERMVLMVQKEVAERICAKPGDMSVLSIAVQYYADAEIVMQVPRTMFWPVPAVDSAVIAIKKTKNQESKKSNDDFFRLVKIGFANRRKLLYKNLLPFVGKKNSDILKKAFADLGFDPARARAQELSVEQWKTLVMSLREGTK